MEPIFFYKTIQVAIILIFLVFVSDIRKKNVTKTLVNPAILKIMKISYSIPLGLFLFAVISMTQIFTKDWIAILLTGLGLLIVIMAKTTLGPNHSWTGLGTYPKDFIAKGIYSYIRHPMYTGIFICIGGMLIFIIGHLTWFFVLLDVAGSIYIVYVLTTSAERETQHLLKLFDRPFEEYVNNTPAFWPLFKQNKTQPSNQQE